MAVPRISAIVRTRDEAASLGRCLESLLDQDTDGRALEVLLVDSGSRDQTVAIASSFGARVISIPAEQFTFGGALNLGAANATGEILVALSADAFLPDREWLGRLVAHFADERVACASGERFRADGERLEGVVAQDLELVRATPFWGYSNAAGGFRASLWRERPFRSDLAGCEDKEWASYWAGRGRLSIVDPSLAPDHDHTHDPLPRIYRRARREAEAYGTYLALPDYRPRELIEEWWSDLRFYSSPLRSRLSHRRVARLLGTYAGRRRARRGP
jgi:rhamnosyltransferase